jgi:hypothetical protein
MTGYVALMGEKRNAYVIGGQATMKEFARKI